ESGSMWSNRDCSRGLRFAMVSTIGAWEPVVFRVRGITRPRHQGALLPSIATSRPRDCAAGSGSIRRGVDRRTGEDFTTSGRVAPINTAGTMSTANDIANRTKVNTDRESDKNGYTRM